MQRRLERIASPSMGRHIHLWCYGHFGPPLVVFPSASGMAHEWESHSMVDALAPLIDAGRLKLYCTESNVAEAWTRKESDPHWRIQRHMAYEQYVLRDLVPFVRRDCNSESIRIAAAGTSLGAFYACNFALKHSEIFDYALCMSGRYDIREFAQGLDNSDIYFNNPMAYVPNLNGALLDRIRKETHITLICGRGKWEDGNIEETQAFAEILAGQGISHEADIWGHDVSHEWGWWRRQALLHLGRRYGGDG